MKNIFIPEQITKPLITYPMNKSWKEGNKCNYWATNYSGKLDKDTLVPHSDNEKWRNKQYKLFLQAIEIRNKLLTFGGEEACVFPDADDGYNILNKGQFFYGNNSKMMKGSPCQCHRNSCYLWSANKDRDNLFICTGYALSEDGMWRQHSWLVLDNPRSYKIIETTKKRIAYYGYIMTKEECQNFYDDNC